MFPGSKKIARKYSYDPRHLTDLQLVRFCIILEPNVLEDKSIEDDTHGLPTLSFWSS